MLCGCACLFQLCTLLAESVLGFCNCDDNRMWGFLFMILCGFNAVLTIAGASLAIDTESVPANLTGTEKKQDNVWYFYFAILTATLPTRVFSIFLKFKDITRGSE